MAGIIWKLFFLAAAIRVSSAQVDASGVRIEVTSNAGGDVILQCSVDGSSTQPVQWFSNRTGDFLQIVGGDQQSDLQVYTDNNTLIIRRIALVGVGYFRCTSSSGNSALSQIIGRSPLRIERHPLGNGDLLLVCSVAGGTTTPIRWYYQREGTETRLMGGGNNDHVQVLTNNTLIVRDFEMEDEGRYICNATYQGWNWTASANVRKSVSPVKITTYQAENQDLFLTCTLNEMPSMGVVLWTIDLDNDANDVVQVAMLGNDTSHVQILANNTLLVRGYTADDAGIYTCNTTVSPGGQWRAARARVAGGPISVAANFLLVFFVSLLPSLWRVMAF